MNTVDILDLYLCDQDRDRHIVTPICVYLRKRYGLRIISKTVVNGPYWLLRYRPKLLLLANPHGQRETVDVIKLASELGIRVVTAVAEGNFQEDNVDGYVWGWNTEKKCYSDLMLLWNRKSLRITTQHYPEILSRLCVTGAVGFDRYRLLQFLSRDRFLGGQKSTLKKVIGIAGWGIFSNFLDADYMEKFRQLFLQAYTDEQIEMHRNDLTQLRKIYRKIILDNPDIFFILRLHPQAKRIEQTEFVDCLDLQNAFVSNQYVPGTFSISDIISASDYWIAYESGTAIEAWLLHKQTVLVNPSGVDFVRENAFRGSVIVRTADELNAVIRTAYATGNIPGFEELRGSREEVIADVLESDDGNNHQRAGEATMKIYMSAKPPSIDFYRRFPYRHAFGQALRYWLYPSRVYKMLRKQAVIPDWYYPKDKDAVDRIEREYENVIHP